MLIHYYFFLCVVYPPFPNTHTHKEILDDENSACWTNSSTGVPLCQSTRCHISEPFRGAVFCDDLFSILRDPGANSATAMSDTGVSGENNL